MASPRPKSPRPPVGARKDEKEESFWEKIGTLGRKKRIKEGMYILLYVVLRTCKLISVVFSVSSIFLHDRIW
jgi:hypothetical protein